MYVPLDRVTRSRIIALAVILFLALFAFGSWWAVERIEDDLADRTRDRLAELGHPETHVDVDGQDVTLGPVPEHVADEIRSLDGVRGVDVETDVTVPTTTTTTTPTTTPSTTTPSTTTPSTTTPSTTTPSTTTQPPVAARGVVQLDVEPDGVILAGESTVETRDLLLDVLNSGTRPVTDAIDVVDTTEFTPANIDELGALVDAFADLDQGSLAAEPDSIVVNVVVVDDDDADAYVVLETLIGGMSSFGDAELAGESPDGVSFDALIAAARARADGDTHLVPAGAGAGDGLAVASFDIDWAVDAVDEPTAVVSGTVVNERQRAALIAAAAALVDGEPVDELVVVPGAEALAGSDTRIEAVTETLEALRGTSEGSVRLRGARLVVETDAPAVAEPLSVVLDGAPLRPVTTLLGSDSSTDSDLVASIMFASGEATDDAFDRAELARVVSLVEAAEPDAEIVLTGHTDSQGSRSLNLALATERAQRIVELLEAAGVDASRLRVVSMGENDPIAPNTTAAGRQLNRRVDIEIVGA